MAALIHFYYVLDLVVYGGVSRIFLWSSVQINENRFDIKYLKENVETFIDCLCHGMASVMFCSLLPLHLQVLSITVGLALLYKFCFKAKYFMTEKHMMPSFLHFLVETK